MRLYVKKPMCVREQTLGVRQSMDMYALFKDKCMDIREYPWSCIGILYGYPWFQRGWIFAYRGTNHVSMAQKAEGEWELKIVTFSDERWEVSW